MNSFVRTVCWGVGLSFLAASMASCGAQGLHAGTPSMAAPMMPPMPGAVNAEMAAPTSPAATTAAGLGQAQAPNTERYARISENAFLSVSQAPLSTFSIDVDTASYANVRRFLNDRALPPADAVRIEEMVNYFSYDYPPPSGNDPFSVTTEVSVCPWNTAHRLVRIGLKGRQMASAQLPSRNLVFLLDVSGSMDDPRKLPLLKSAFSMLTDQLNENDSVAIVVYAGASGVVLPPTRGSEKDTIKASLSRLSAGGSTNGGQGIQLAYQLARQSFRPQGVNRVILATDGDFNVGTTGQGDLERLIEDQRKSGVFLTVLGLGTDNVNDSMMESLADKGNGNYAYLDSVNEARKVLVEQANSTLVPIAKDVKLQIEFNPTRVQSYRLIGYENRMLRAEDFKDDRKDAGEMGVGHTVTALYELVPVGEANPAGNVDPLKYQSGTKPTAAAQGAELMTIKTRFKPPQGDTSQERAYPVQDRSVSINQASQDFRFAASVASFGMLLRNSEHKGQSSFSLVRELAQSSTGRDPGGYRAEFIRLVDQTQRLAGGQTVQTVAR